MFVVAWIRRVRVRRAINRMTSEEIASMLRRIEVLTTEKRQRDLVIADLKRQLRETERV